MRKLSIRRSCPQRRSGLAPLEMVLLTPFIVLMGALMVCFGDAALWKIRAQSGARYAGTQTEPYRQTHFLSGHFGNPRPSSWPNPATMSGSGGGNLGDVHAYWEGRYSGTPWVPVQWEPPGSVDEPVEGSGSGGFRAALTDPYLGNVIELDPRLDIERGAHEGNATVSKQFPLLQTMLPNNGRFRVDHDYEFLTGSWHFGNIGPGSNRGRRANDLYEINPDEMREMSNEWAAFDGAFQALLHDLPASEKKKLNPLDDDDEFKLVNSGWAPNFHPHPDFYCEIEIAEYYLDGRYQDYLKEIRSVPINMALSFYNLYYAELLWRKHGHPPRLPDTDRMLQQKMAQMKSFVNILRGRNFVNGQ